MRLPPLEPADPLDPPRNPRKTCIINSFQYLNECTLIGVALYAFMLLILKQTPAVAENRSICIAAAVLIYMIVFGHGLPGRVNPQL
jgi:hypothetical protein